MKLLGLGACILVVGAGVLFVAMKNQVDTTRYEKQLIDSIKAQTGMDAIIDGNTDFTLFPAPKMTVTQLHLGTGDVVNNAVPTFTVEKLEVNLSPVSIVAGKVEITDIKMVHPVLSVERAEDDTIHWGWLNSQLMKNLSPQGPAASGLTVNIVGGVISYQDSRHGTDLTIENIRANGSFGSQFALHGMMQSRGREFALSMDSTANNLNASGNAFPLNIVLASGEQDALQFNASVDFSKPDAKMDASFMVQSGDIQNWLFDGAERAAKTALPFLLSGDWKQAAGDISLNNLIIKAMSSEGKGTAKMRWNKWYPTIQTELKFGSLDYALWRDLFKALAAEPAKQDGASNGSIAVENTTGQNPLPQNIELNAVVNIDKLLYGAKDFGASKLDVALDKGALTLNQCDMSLPGEGMLSLFGVVSQGANGTMRFEGNVESRGKSLRDALAVLEVESGDLPAIGLGQYTFSANMFAAADQMRFSEAKANLEGGDITGVVIAYRGDTPRVEANLKLQDVNFDFVRNGYRKNSKSTDSLINFDWLKKLRTRIDAKLFIDGFTFMDRKGTKASMSVYASDGDMRLYDVQMTYPDHTTDINFGINVKSGQPSVRLQLNTDLLDTRYFSLGEAVVEKSRNAMLDEPIDFGWMNGFNGAFDISLGKLIHGSLTFENVKLQAKLEDKRLQIQKLGFVYSQAESTLLGTVYGGKVPGASLSFTMANADMYELMNSLIGLNNISGFSSMSGTLSTSGLNYGAWLQQMDAKLLLSGRGVKVDGVNIAGVSNLIGVARSSADVFNNTSKILTNGSTAFSIDGSININDGQMRTPGMTLKSGLVTGNMVGGVKLVTMNLQLSTLFKFANLASDPVPTMIVQLAGPLEKPDINVDTSSLEAFVAKRMVGR